MKTPWKSLFNKINNRIQVAKNTFYEVVWIAYSEDNKNFGETRFDPPQIVIEQGHSEKSTVETYLHEILHAISEEYDVGLTETQVRKLEKALSYVLKPGNIFKE